MTENLLRQFFLVLRRQPAVTTHPGKLRHAKWTEIDFGQSENKLHYSFPAYLLRSDRIFVRKTDDSVSGKPTNKGGYYLWSYQLVIRLCFLRKY